MTDNPWPVQGFEHLAAGIAIFKALFYPSKHWPLVNEAKIAWKLPPSISM